MTLQDLFYLVATLYLILTGLAGAFIFFQILKFLEFIRNQKKHGEEVLLTAVQAKYALQTAFLRFVLKFLRGGEKNGQ
jgi:hypothetical protein